MSELNLDHLRKIAEAATPGPWSADIYRSERRSPKTRRWLKWKPEYGHHGTVSVIDSDGVYGVLDGPDAEHIATFDPPMALALIDEISRLRTEADTAIQQAENWSEEFAALQTRIRGYAKEREATGGTIDSSRVAADLLRIVGDL